MCLHTWKLTSIFSFVDSQELKLKRALVVYLNCTLRHLAKDKESVLTCYKKKFKNLFSKHFYFIELKALYSN